jgi:hypothetical protein
LLPLELEPLDEVRVLPPELQLWLEPPLELRLLLKLELWEE